MKISFLRASVAVMLAVVWLTQPALAQQETVAPASPPTQPASEPAANPSPNPVAPAAEAPAAPVPDAKSADASSRSPKSISPLMSELSPWSMFMSAAVVVKAVMIGLALASVATWTIFIAKSIELSRMRRKLRLALRRIADASSLADAKLALGANEGILPSLLAAAIREARLSADLSSDSGIKERAASSFAEIVRAEARRIHFGMGVLATVGATSPFVGLFGTVWGIMNSFIGISKSQTTNLAVVAPGIAEALLATAIGLVAAIPAVIIYNYFARVTKGYLELVSRASGASGRLLSRDLDRGLDRGLGSVHSRAAE